MRNEMPSFLGLHSYGAPLLAHWVVTEIKLLNEVPLLLRKDIYALACIAGGVVYFICLQFHVLANVTELIAALTVIFVRIIRAKIPYSPACIEIYQRQYRQNINV